MLQKCKKDAQVDTALWREVCCSVLSKTNHESFFNNENDKNDKNDQNSNSDNNDIYSETAEIAESTDDFLNSAILHAAFLIVKTNWAISDNQNAEDIFLLLNTYHYLCRSLHENISVTQDKNQESGTDSDFYCVSSETLV